MVGEREYFCSHSSLLEKTIVWVCVCVCVCVWVCGCVLVPVRVCIWNSNKGGGKACTNDDCTVCFTFPFAHAGVHSRSLALVEKERGERKAEGGVWLCHHGWPKVRHTSHAFFL